MSSVVSSVVQDASHQKLSPGLPLTEHDERTRELSHIESILRSRRMELHDVTAGLLERRKELDAVTEQVFTKLLEGNTSLICIKLYQNKPITKQSNSKIISDKQEKERKKKKNDH